MCGRARAATADITELERLAVRLAVDELGNLLSGRAYYALACDIDREAGDDHLTAAEAMTTAAFEHLTTAIERARLAPRPRVLVLINLAPAELHSGNLPAACSRATQAADLLHRAAYALGALPACVPHHCSAAFERSSFTCPR